jgi:hypothetical protein
MLKTVISWTHNIYDIVSITKLCVNIHYKFQNLKLLIFHPILIGFLQKDYLNELCSKLLFVCLGFWYAFCVIVSNTLNVKESLKIYLIQQKIFSLPFAFMYLWIFILDQKKNMCVSNRPTDTKIVPPTPTFFMPKK